MSTELKSNSVAEENTTMKLHRADWEAFQESCWENLTISQFQSEEEVDVPVALFTTKLNKIAEKNIANTLTKKSQ